MTAKRESCKLWISGNGILYPAKSAKNSLKNRAEKNKKVCCCKTDEKIPQETRTSGSRVPESEKRGEESEFKTE